MCAFGFAVKMIGTQVLVERTILEHVISGGEHGGGNGTDRLLGPALGAQTLKLRLKVASLLASGGPGALDQSCL